MTTEIRSQLNVRGSADMNISISVMTLVDTEEEARDAGYRNRCLVDAYLAGYLAAADTEETTT